MNTDREDMKYLNEQLRAASLVPYPWSGEDRNLRAFRSKDELVNWYGQTPGVVGEPYRDRGFYCRELAMLSHTIRPRTIVELGTSLGIGTCLLYWLNPDARLTTVDSESETFLPGNVRVPMGHISRLQGVPCTYVKADSRDYRQDGVDLCFVDANHAYSNVLADSMAAWINRAVDGHRWAIAWHDYNDRHPGVMIAVDEFCSAMSVPLQSRPDSDTVWIEGQQ